MTKPGIRIEIPGLGNRHIKTLLSDYTGTHSVGGKLVPDAKWRLRGLAKKVDIVILTSDSYGTAIKS